jgi:propanol-preferring alcohol dehydrogenase
VDGELPDPKLPLIPGHQIVGTVEEVGARVERFARGDRVGVPWLGYIDGTCRYCLSGRENLCDNARFTGYQIDGGYAEYTVADHRFCFTIPENYHDLQAAPLLCAGLIGYRSFRMTGGAERIGLYGFGDAAHIIIQVALHQGRKVFAFTRDGDEERQSFARELGAAWAGGSSELPPEELDAAIIFAPVGALVPLALRAVAKGGVVVCAGIHMSDIPSFPYEILWGERSVRSVANLTRADGEEFLALAPQVPVRTEVTPFPLEGANEALAALRGGMIQGAAVLVVEQTG